MASQLDLSAVDPSVTVFAGCYLGDSGDFKGFQRVFVVIE